MISILVQEVIVVTATRKKTETPVSMDEMIMSSRGMEALQTTVENLQAKYDKHTLKYTEDTAHLKTTVKMLDESVKSTQSKIEDIKESQQEINILMSSFKSNFDHLAETILNIKAEQNILSTQSNKFTEQYTVKTGTLNDDIRDIKHMLNTLAASIESIRKDFSDYTIKNDKRIDDIKIDYDAKFKLIDEAHDKYNKLITAGQTIRWVGGALLATVLFGTQMFKSILDFFTTK